MKEKLAIVLVILTALIVVAIIIVGSINKSNRVNAVLGRPFVLHNTTYIGINSIFDYVECMATDGRTIRLDIAAIEALLNRPEK
jgi:hypothetical protein